MSVIGRSSQGRDAVAEALLDAGADASLRYGGDMALESAAREGNVNVLAALVRNGADINDACVSGRTAVHCAAAANMVDSIDILIAAGANTEAREMLKSTPVHVAVREFIFEATVALLKHGAVIDARNVLKQTPLHVAAAEAGKRGAMEMVDLLLRWGADETATTGFCGTTPADDAGKRCSDIQEVGGAERVRKLLANALAAREAWRRRGLLVASRARPQMVLLSTSTQPPGELRNLIGGVLGLVEDGVFRTIVGYL